MESIEDDSLIAMVCTSTAKGDKNYVSKLSEMLKSWGCPQFTSTPTNRSSIHLSFNSRSDALRTLQIMHHRDGTCANIRVGSNTVFTFAHDGDWSLKHSLLSSKTRANNNLNLETLRVAIKEFIPELSAVTVMNNGR